MTCEFDFEDPHSSLDAFVEVFEEVSGGVPRLFFQKDDLSLNRLITNFTFSTTNVFSCTEVPVFVKVHVYICNVCVCHVEVYMHIVTKQ